MMHFEGHQPSVRPDSKIRGLHLGSGLWYEGSLQVTPKAPGIVSLARSGGIFLLADFPAKGHLLGFAAALAQFLTDGKLAFGGSL